MKQSLSIAFLILVAVFSTACSKYVTLEALQPAKVGRASSTKKVAVVEFKHDRLGLASKIESNLGHFRIQGKPYFTMVSRSNIRQILREQKLQNSGLVEDEDIVEAGNLIGAEALISGNVSRLSTSDSSFYVTRSACANSKCTRMYYYDVLCTRRHYSLSADIKMVDVALGDVIYSDNISRGTSYEQCRDDNRMLPSIDAVGEDLAMSIASAFTYQLTPHYVRFNVELLEDPDLDYTDEQEYLLENALIYMEQRRYDKAEQLLIRLVDSTAQQSYVAFYNLGVIKEVKGEYEDAKHMYEKADALMVEPVEAISRAYNRIHRVIKEHNITMQQIER